MSYRGLNVAAKLGIGKELALQYAARGARLLLIARREALLQKLTVECLIHPLCSQARFLAADITIENEVHKAAQMAREVLGGCDTVVINAGIISVLTFEDVCKLDENETADGETGEKTTTTPTTTTEMTTRLAQIVEQMFRVNVVAPIMIAKYFRTMAVESKGKFVVVSSVAGTMAAPTRSLYAATKHALNGFFNSFRIEVARQGVAVCICLPGSVATDLRASAVDASSTTTTTAAAAASSYATNASVSSASEGSKLSASDCARRIIHASDLRARETYMPSKYRLAFLLHCFFPSFIDTLAAKKYGF
ncbi:hypothetical protein PhCBS80983_g01443 [Powellomyces hirtus]|uniref:3-oxoacyl-[acyl-carrier-protein] reductase n=1 Tax=Powellomyces hirtus TaxID=109895 RepID=A0A507ECX7_9FUNG|nr:hypothetical protein PhCBS80983_g01443 [Powellomyces hirtus]